MSVALRTGTEGKAAWINTDNMMDEDVKPPGQPTTQELKNKAGSWEANHMALLHIVAERREKKFQFKASRENLHKYSDRKTERKEKYDKRQEVRVTKKMSMMDKEEQAAMQTRELNEKASLLDQNTAQGKEKEAKSSNELSVNIKALEKMKEGESDSAKGDRDTIQAALASMRVAKAHADRYITGLSKKERKSHVLVMMHAAMEKAVGDPNAGNVAAAKAAIEDGVADIEREKEVNNKKLVKTAQETTNKELVHKEEALAAEKATKEYKQKRASWKKSKLAENMQIGYNLPVELNKLQNGKYWNGELADKWAAGQKRIADEIAVKQHHELVLMETKEKEQKKDEADQYKSYDEQCNYLEGERQKVLARRSDAIAYYNKARDAVRRPPAGADVHTRAALDRRVEAAKDRMYGANERAADADLQLRHCQSQKVRRRRTCACDDPPKRRMREMMDKDVLLQVAALPQPLPWIRRRQVKHPWKAPSPTQRRRAYVFDTSQNEKPRFAMFPGMVCPCCNSAERPQRAICLIKDVKEKILKNKARRNAPPKPKNEKAGDPRFHYRSPGKSGFSTNPPARALEGVAKGDKEPAGL